MSFLPPNQQSQSTEGKIIRRDNNHVPIATLWRQAIGRGHSRATLRSQPTIRVNDDDDDDIGDNYSSSTAPTAYLTYRCRACCRCSAVSRPSRRTTWSACRPPRAWHAPPRAGREPPPATCSTAVKTKSGPCPWRAGAPRGARSGRNLACPFASQTHAQCVRSTSVLDQ